MSYLVLARKWRPRSFAEVVGQRSVVRTLQNALAQDRVAHAMLFSGVRGVGKTTLARIMAKALNCRGGEGETKPCNRCDSCREFNASSAVDLHEIDGAGNRGIQEIRELKENLRFMPVSGKFKIVIIDEVHMLTTEAFNALLKTLEEPPAHVYFMFATTELHKIPVTILSRCQRYELTRVAFSELLEFFRKVSLAEGVVIPDSALEMITREADGSVRDGLSLLDQVFSFGGEEVSDDDVRQMLGLVDRRIFEHLARALLSSDLAGSLKLFQDCYSAGIDLKRFAADLLNYFRNLVICSSLDQPGSLLDLADGELAVLKEIAADYSTETLIHCFNLLFKGVEEMQYSSRPRLALEMTMVRATRAGQIVPTAQVLEKLDLLLPGLPGAGASAGGRPEPSAHSVSMENSKPGTALSLAEPLAPSPAVPFYPEEKVQEEQKSAVLDDHPFLPEGKSLENSSPETGKSAAMRPKKEVEPSFEVGKLEQSKGVAPRDSGRDLRPQWDGFVAYVKKRKVWMAPVLEMASGVREENGELRIRYDDEADCKLLEEAANNRLLTEFAQDYFQRELTVRLRIRGGGTVAVGGEEGPQAQRRSLTRDSLVQTVVEIFNGDIANIRTAGVS